MARSLATEKGTAISGHQTADLVDQLLTFPLRTGVKWQGKKTQLSFKLLKRIFWSIDTMV